MTGRERLIVAALVALVLLTVGLVGWLVPGPAPPPPQPAEIATENDAAPATPRPSVPAPVPVRRAPPPAAAAVQATELAGSVHDRNGKPVPAHLALAGPQMPRGRTLVAAADGAFRVLDLAPGVYMLRATASGFRPATPIDIEVRAGEVARIEVLLDRLSGVLGKVVGPDGEPVPLATVRIVWPNAEQRVPTNSDGRFEFDAPDIDWSQVTVEAATPAHDPVPPERARPGEEVVLRLGPGGYLEGFVRDTAGAPLAEATVALESISVDGPEALGSRHLPAIQAGPPDGRFRLGPLRPGRYDLRAESAGLAPGFARGNSVGRGGTTGGIVITLSGGATLRGRISARDGGVPVVGANVTVFEPGSALAPKLVRSDAEGRYEVVGVGSGRRSMRVTHADYLAEIAAGIAVPASGDVVRDVVLERARPGERMAFHGIGATLKGGPRGIEVQGLVEGSPAQASGLRAGDIIAGVDGQPTAQLSVSQVVELIRGEAGVAVTIDVERAGQGRFPLRIERGRVVIKQ